MILIVVKVAEKRQLYDFNGLPQDYHGFLFRRSGGVLGGQMKIIPTTVDGRVYLRIEDADTFEEIQAEINRLHGRVKFIGPEKHGDKYIAVGMPTFLISLENNKDNPR